MTQVLQLLPGGKHRTVDIPSTNRGQTIVDFGVGGASNVSVNVTGQAGIQASSVVLVQVAIAASADHTADEHTVERLRVMAGNVVAGTGFTIYARTENASLFGKYNIQWMWS